jgi:arylsulfatase A-like enzyme
MTKNILFISMDDCAAYWDYRSVFKETLQTPNLDRICERATVFRAAYCAAPLCGPSRATRMSGLAPHHSGVVSNDEYVFNHISPKQMWSFDRGRRGGFVRHIITYIKKIMSALSRAL